MSTRHEVSPRLTCTRFASAKPVLRQSADVSASEFYARGTQSRCNFAPLTSNCAGNSMATAHSGKAVVSPRATTFDENKLSVKPVTVTEPATPRSASDSGVNKTNPTVVARSSRVLIALDGDPRKNAHGASSFVNRKENHFD